MNVATILIIVNVFAALAIIVLALMQTSKGDMGSAFGGGGSQGMFGARGSSNFLSKSTSVMCIVFFLSSLWLAYVYAQRNVSDSSIVDTSSVVDQIVSEVPTVEEGVFVVEEDSSVPAVSSDDLEAAVTDEVVTDIVEAAAEENPKKDTKEIIEQPEEAPATEGTSEKEPAIIE